MGLFNDLMAKIFRHSTSGSAPTTAGTGPGGPTTQQAATPGAESAQTATPAPGSAAAPATQSVDVEAILNGLAAKNPEKLDWKHSIVDLMKLVGMDSSLSARKQLATELHYTGDQNDSAAMNMWLHKQVLRKLAENGGKVPQDLLK
jgi:hypothetical protein